MSYDERTPLITTVRIAPQRRRYPHDTLRRFCTVSLTTTFIVIVILFCFPAGFGNLSAYLPWKSPYPHQNWPQSSGIEYKDLQKILLKTPDAKKTKEWSDYYTAGPHLAGKNLSQAIWTQERWQEFGIEDSTLVSYDVFLNYPIGHRLALLEKSGKSKRDADTEVEKGWKVKFEASLTEDVLDKDPTSGLDDRIPTFHGYSANGNVTAGYVYCNYGTYWDYEELLKAGVVLEGKIALTRYGGNFRGLKVKRAQELGMVGVVIYSDPGDDGNMTEANGYKTYPAGPARNPSSVQRGSVDYLNIAPGDPTTPGYPSKPGVPRAPTNGSIPSIPSLPISYLDALPLLKALNGHGPNASSLSKYWKGGGLGYKGVHYNIGPSPDDIKLNLVNEQEYVTTPLWNVIGIINGTVQDEVIVIGNHRDAWIAGGAGDPNSGSAALNEVVRSFGKAVAQGWKPLRTVIFASWDGEEYSLIGSTEWVEEFFPWLQATAVAYLNVDVGAVGPYYDASASPLLNELIYETTSLVSSPNKTRGHSIKDTWDGKIRTMGSGSDFTAFQDFAGIPCVDMGFRPGYDSPVYHYHSNYDSEYWMDKFGDPTWEYHVAIAKIWALMAAKLIETPIIPLNVTDYSKGLHRYFESIEKKLEDVSAEKDGFGKADWTSFAAALNDLASAIQDFGPVAKSFDVSAAELAEKLKEDIPWWQWWKKVALMIKVRKTNGAYKYFERAFLYEGGLDNRPLFKHTIFAPGLWTGYSGAVFPGIVESIDAKDWDNGAKWARIIEGQVKAATKLLEGAEK